MQSRFQNTTLIVLLTLRLASAAVPVWRPAKNASAMLFVAAKVSHLGHLPQGQPERNKRVLAMVRQMDAEGFGNCTNQYECEAACPKEISVDHIARMNRDYAKAVLVEQFA